MPESKTTLYVIFHGLWVFETTKDWIYAHTPIDEEHEIRAGHIVTAQSAKKVKGDLLVPGLYRLLGVDNGQVNEFDTNDNPVVQNTKLEQPHRRFCEIRLPPAVKIRSLRLVDTSGPTKAKHPFAGIVGENLKPPRVAMVQVFEYLTADWKQVQLEPLKRETTMPLFNQSTNTATLHVHASPSGGLHNPYHARNAYSKMAEMFKLDIVAITGLYAHAHDEGIPGLTVDDMLSLMELREGAHQPAAGASGSNCDALVIDNRGLSA
jgi:hypothetical protein